ncbi:MAG: HAMP domain-containing sensor histidine kinase, partial [Verrucomicrobiota bacterium]
NWYWNDGLHFIIWHREPKTGRTIGVEVERMRLMSEVLTTLPAEGESYKRRQSDQSRVELRDVADQLLYGWGEFSPAGEAEPTATLKLDRPLQSWSLAYFSNLSAAKGDASNSPFYTTLSLLFIALLVSVGLAIYFYREMSRQMRDAAQRVTFVNQVSHELKTPLTNIRMYAELLQEKLEPEDVGKNRDLRVIVGESQRLSRLISNVLTFSQSQQEKITLRYRQGSVDDTIRRTVDQFRPSLDDGEFAFELELNAEDACRFDTDAVEQILTNLLSNVEKYARQGQWVKITSSLDGSCCEIRLRDAGPGIPDTKREWIFQPFERLSDKLSDAAGTGIGLNIARNLARLHGGDLTCEPSTEGAEFRLTIQVK